MRAEICGMRGLAVGLGVFFLMQGCLRLELIPLGLLARSVPLAIFLLPWLVIGVAFVALLVYSVGTILRHGRRVSAGSAPTPGCARGRLMGFPYELELPYFRSIAVRFSRTLLGTSWCMGSMVLGALACALMIQGGQLENQSLPIVQGMLNFCLGFALLSLPIYLWLGRTFENFIDRVIHKASAPI